MNFLLIGGKGLVLSRFVQLNPSSVLPVLDFPEIDIVDYESVARYIEDNQDTEDLVVILGAAYTDVDSAENEKERGNLEGRVYKVNVVGTRNVAKVCRQFGVFLIYISTDFVFTGTADNKGPYSEDTQPVMDEKHLGWYAQTKLLGEEEVQQTGGASAIVRISYPFRADFERLDFARTFLNLYDRCSLPPLFVDQFLTPTFIDETVPVLDKIAKKKLKGIFHCISVNITTPYEFASYLFKKVRNVENVVEKCSFVEFYRRFPEKAPRPQYGGLTSEKTQKTLGLKFMTWQEQVDELARQMKLLKKI